MSYSSTKIIELGSCAFRQWKAESHCRYIHGYRLIAKFWFECNNLDDRNWVVDFGGLKELRNLLEKQFDHTFCVSIDDPFLRDFKALHDKGVIDLRVMDGVGIEKTAEWCFYTADTFVRKETNERCWVSRVEVWEHDKNSAIFSINRVKNTFTIPARTNQQTATFLEEVTKETGVDLSNVLKNVPPTAAEPNLTAAQPQQGPRPAPVGNTVTSGYSNLFGGTSWGM
jgi:6-pyruvoyltetrahydropterin/6-carboxytetrahydropterin synthase